MPTTQEIRDAVGGGKASEQAQLIIESIGKRGRYWSASWDDPVTAELMRGEWSRLCDMNDARLEAWERSFIALYNKKTTRKAELIEGRDNPRLVDLAGKIGRNL